MPSFPLLALVVTLAATVGAASGAWVREVPHRLLGWAHGIAAGLMLGLAYLLSAASAGRPPLLVSLGSLVGVVGILLVHRGLGIAEMDRLAGEPRRRTHDGAGPGNDAGGALLAASAIHDGVEGLALGCALVLDPWLGLAAAAVLAIHNVAESGSLAAVLTRLARRRWRAFSETLLTNLPMPLVAFGVWRAIGHDPGGILFPVLVGVAVGALIYLVLVDLLPEAYELAGQTRIALAVTAGIVLVVALEGWLG